MSINSELDLKTRFTQVLMKELVRILIHIRKIFNYRVSFKMLMSMYRAIVPNDVNVSRDCPERILNIVVIK